MKLEHRPGHLHIIADAMTRGPIVAADNGLLVQEPHLEPEMFSWLFRNDLTPTLAPTPTALPVAAPVPSNNNSLALSGLGAALPRWCKAQHSDPLLSKVFEALQSKASFGNNVTGHKVKFMAGQSTIGENGCLYFTNTPFRTIGPRMWRLIVPTDLIGELLHEYHDGAAGGHRSHHQVVESLSQKYWWPKMSGSVRNYIRRCTVCQERSQPRSRPPGLLQPIEPPEAPRMRWAIDLVDLPKNDRASKLCVAIDCFSRWVEAAPIRDASAASVADFVINHIALRHGCPTVMQSDGGHEFENELVARMLHTMGTRKVTTTPYHPQANGAVERVNKPLVDNISKLCSSHQLDWDLFVTAAVWGHNCSVHSSTGVSPFFLMHGVEPNTGIDIVLGQVSKDIDAATRLQQVLPEVRERIRAAQEDYKERYDQNRAEPTFKVNDLVLLHRPQFDIAPGKSRKLIRPWHGPYKILRVYDNGIVFEIQSVARPTDTQRGSGQRLKRYFPPEDELPLQAGVFEVQDIIGERMHEGKHQFLIMWKGWTKRYASWEENNMDAPEILKRWRAHSGVAPASHHSTSSCTPSISNSSYTCHYSSATKGVLNKSGSAYTSPSSLFQLRGGTCQDKTRQDSYSI